MDTEPTNDTRAERALTCIRADSDDNDLSTQITDLLANLRHLCHREGVDFDACNLSGEIHFQAEQEEEAENTCTSCGEDNTGGEGYDGLCGNCADKECAS